MKLKDYRPKLKKTEAQDLARFSDFLYSKGLRPTAVIEKPDKQAMVTSKKGMFDYLIEDENGRMIALEFMRLYEAPRKRMQQIQWSNLVVAFKRELQKYLSTEGHYPWTGIWRVETGENFGASRNTANDIAKKYTSRLIDAVRKGLDSLRIDNMIIKLSKLVDQPEGDLSFSTGVTVSTVDPPTEIYQRLNRLLPVKDRQLDTDKGERYLVIVNRYPLASAEDVVNAMSRGSSVWKISNIDKIYFEESPGHFSLIFTKGLVDAWNQRGIIVNNDLLLVIQLWLPYLRALDIDRTLYIVSGILRDAKPYEVFPDPRVREEIVRLAESLVEQDRSDDAITWISKLIDDPNPPEPGEYDMNPAYDYHQQIVNGEDPGIITSVRGHLAWLVQKLCLQRKYILLSLDYTKALLKYENLYAKLQAIIPLIEIAARRHWLEEMDFEKYWEFHNITFNLLKRYSRYPAIANLLTHVFYYFKDLTTEEALEVIERLRTARESGTLYVYFGIFREGHYKNVDGSDKRNFEAEPLRKQLEYAILTDDKSYSELKADIAWNFWAMLKDSPAELQRIRQYVDLFLQQPYQIEVYRRLDMIIERCLDIEPAVSIVWFSRMLDNLYEFIKAHADQARDIWLTTPEELLTAIASKEPDRMVEIMYKLVEAWKQGVYIGDPSKLFETFRLIGNKDLKTTTKQEFRQLHKSMKEINPRLSSVRWS